MKNVRSDNDASEMDICLRAIVTFSDIVTIRVTLFPEKNA